ncbi:unnamed protein product [Effrenium voratum]|nr:unnamed protein product [Effrenium voratum]
MESVFVPGARSLGAEPRPKASDLRGHARQAPGGLSGPTLPILVLASTLVGKSYRRSCRQSRRTLRPLRASEVMLPDTLFDLEPTESWSSKLGIVPPDDIRRRIRLTRGMLEKDLLAYIGDTVWEYLVLRHQYQQVVRSPFTESQKVRSIRQANAAVMLFRGEALTERERTVVLEGAQKTWLSKVRMNFDNIQEVGVNAYSSALGLRTLLGYAYMDAAASDADLTRIVDEIGLLTPPGTEDKMLSEITGGIFDPSLRPPGSYFLALAPLGHAALRLYICRYLCERPTQASEFIYRVKMALRQDELDAAAAAFLLDSATAEEARLMQGAREQRDSYAFAFECLLGDLALRLPYRLHQIVSQFGWAQPLEGT